MSSNDNTPLSEFYYFDGIKFQKCVTHSSSKGLILDNSIDDTLHYKANGGIETLLTFAKIDKNCLYNPENIPNLLYILDCNGWQGIATVDMDIRPKGLATKDEIVINIRPVENIIASDIMELDTFTYSNLNTGDNVEVIVKLVPNVEHTEILQLHSTKLDSIKVMNTVSISKPPCTIHILEDILNLTKLYTNTIESNEIVNITLEKGEG